MKVFNLFHDGPQFFAATQVGNVFPQLAFFCYCIIHSFKIIQAYVAYISD